MCDVVMCAQRVAIVAAESVEVLDRVVNLQLTALLSLVQLLLQLAAVGAPGGCECRCNLQSYNIHVCSNDHNHLQQVRANFDSVQYWCWPSGTIERGGLGFVPPELPSKTAGEGGGAGDYFDAVAVVYCCAVARWLYYHMAHFAVVELARPGAGTEQVQVLGAGDLGAVVLVNYSLVSVTMAAVRQLQCDLVSYNLQPVV